MESNEFEATDGLSIRIPKDDGYRTCPECGADCAPEPFDAGNGEGLRIGFACPTHGLHSVVDPFEGDCLNSGVWDPA